MKNLTSDEFQSKLQDFKCGSQQFEANDEHGRGTLTEVSSQSLLAEVGVLFYSEHDARGRLRYEGQIKNGIPGNQNVGQVFFFFATINVWIFLEPDKLFVLP